MPDTTNTDIANLAAADKVSLTHARQIARDFEQWASSQPQAGQAAAGKVRRGFGLGFLLKMGSIVTLLVRAAMALAVGQPVVQRFTVLGSQWELSLRKVA